MNIKSAYFNAALPPIRPARPWPPVLPPLQGLNLNHNPDGTVTITQPKLLLKLFSLYPPRKEQSHKPIHPYPPLPKESDPTPQPTDHFSYLPTTVRYSSIPN